MRSGGPATVVGAATPAEAPTPAQLALMRAVDKYTGRVQGTLNHDALSLARGKKPVREGDELSEEQRAALNQATQDLVKDLPLGALSPELAAAAQKRLEDAGIEVRDIAKDLVKDLKAKSPGAYYSIAGTLAAYAGYVAWNDGSAKLQSLGIKPETKHEFFDKSLQVKLKGEWGAHFQDFNLRTHTEGRLDLGENGKLTASVDVSTRSGFEKATVGYQLTKPNWNLSANASFNHDGFESARVDGRVHGATFNGSAYATANGAGLETVGGSLSYRPTDTFALSGGVNHNFQSGRTTASAEATWKVSKNVDFALSASGDSAGESRVGAGVQIRF